MNDGQLSALTKAMLEAAKADAPSAAAKAKILAGVAGTVGGAAGLGAGGAAAAAAAGTGAAKLLAIGALLGGTVTVGLTVTMLRVGNAPLRPGPAPAAAASIAANVAPATSTSTSTSTPTPTPTSTPTSTPTPTAIPVSTLPLARTPVAAFQPRPKPQQQIDALTREAQLVSEARGALTRGDAGRALAAIRAARALPSHQLGPEELAVEAQALRALGRTGEADQADEALRARYPESALAR
jgi:hypothetical protein